jgi:hypothetical protein
MKAIVWLFAVLAWSGLAEAKTGTVSPQASERTVASSSKVETKERFKALREIEFGVAGV